MKLRKITAMILSAAFLLLLPACQSEEVLKEEGYQPVTILGVGFTEPPEKVVSLSPSTTEMMLELGLIDKLIARTDSCVLPDGSDLPSVGDGNDLDFDAVLAARPDLVISQNPLSKTELDRLNQAGVKALIIPEAKDLRELQSYYAALAAVFFGSEEGIARAKKTVQPLVLATNALRSVLGSDEKISFVYFLKPGTSAATADTFSGSLLSYLGENSAQGDDYAVDLSQVREADPSYIFLSKPYALENLTADPTWADFSAVQSGRVLSFDTSLFERKDFALADLLLETAKTIYPEKAEEIDAAFIGMEAEAVAAEIAEIIETPDDGASSSD